MPLSGSRRQKARGQGASKVRPLPKKRVCAPGALEAADAASGEQLRTSDCWIANESCFSFLPKVPKASVDLVLTDPPYVISRQTGFESCVNGESRFAVSMDFGEWDRAFTEDDLKRSIREFYRVLRPGGTCVVWFDLWKLTPLKAALEDAGFKQCRLIEWIKTNPVPLNSKRNYLTNAREVAVLAVKGGSPTFNAEYHDGVYRHPIYQGQDRCHPTQKPTALFKELIEVHSEPDDVVLDAFLGGGTTAHAARDTGRKFAGCERDPLYYRFSAARVLGDHEGMSAAKTAVKEAAARRKEAAA
ncbi:hypothetical protein CKO28_14200 [Rhodovibrio sodomensis]|uniref:Methyltransferase n=1 Tax=Rhodovibrio sodomensis TaxID=1088 RepID=A0ABS1DIG1_9PROT|nr:site-specific DNA-methyltransferase [Rhodovibrio sodomensis]MBK1669185.1 hypothetical protein [Rhodovibrio sodomensis]